MYIYIYIYIYILIRTWVYMNCESTRVPALSDSLNQQPQDLHKERHEKYVVGKTKVSKLN